VSHVLLMLAAAATTPLYTLSLHDALPISAPVHEVDLRERPLRRLPDGQGEDRRQPRLHRLLLDGEGREEQAGRLDAAQLADRPRSEEHTSELQSPDHLVCRLLLEKKQQTR